MQIAVLWLHVIGATIWTGGHLILALGFLPEALRTNSIDGLQEFEARFEKIGIPALIVQILTGLYMAHLYLSDFSLWFEFSNPLARLVLLKLGCLLLTAALAVDARLRIIPRLTTENLRPLAWHIVPVTVLSILFVTFGIFFRLGGL